MKKILIVRNRWEYYVSNVAGLIILVGLIIWFTYLSASNDGINFKSIFFWLAVLLMITILFGFISILSAMKLVEVTQKGLIISYLFKKHQNDIAFSEVAEFEFKNINKGGVAHSASNRDSFTLVLADGRVFEFGRSQFDNYDKLKSICSKAVNIE